MLAHDPGFLVAHGAGLTALSFIAAAIAMIGLAVAAHGQDRWAAAAVGGGIVGAGIACAYHLGLWAVDPQARAIWSFGWVLASVVFAVLCGALALTMAIRGSDWRAKLSAAILLMLAIVSHHVGTIGAVDIASDPTRVVNTLSPTALAVMVASPAIAMLGLGLISAFADRGLDQQGTLLSTALHNMSQGLLMLHRSGRVILCNDRYLEMYGLEPESVKRGMLRATSSAGARRRGISAATPTPTSPIFCASLQPASPPRRSWNGAAVRFRSPTVRCQEATGLPPTRTSPSDGLPRADLPHLPSERSAAPWSTRRSSRFARTSKPFCER